MVAIFTGLGAGAERGSGNVLGAAGLLGGSSLGRSAEQVLLNAATGNLMIQQKDEMLVGLGPDASVARTYNSRGDLSDENGDNWRQSTDRRIYGAVGPLNQAGSTIKRVSADGSEVTYTYQTITRTSGTTTQNDTGYFATDGSGAYDKLSWNPSTSAWTWTDEDTQFTETYDYASGSQYLLTKQTDTSGNSVTFSYAAGTSHLDKVTTADGNGTQYLQYSWSGNNITQITTSYKDLVANAAKTLTRTRYTYDSANRLSSVTVDLSPEDNSIADGKVYTTTYTYKANSGADMHLVSSITETDGSFLSITYDSSQRVIGLTQTVATGVTRTTTISYVSATRTTVTDAAGQVTTLDYDTSGNLTTITAPPAAAGLPPQVTKFAYNATGDVTSVVDPLGKTTTYSSFTTSGDAQTITETLGGATTTTTRTFDTKNQLLTQTVVGADQSGDGFSHTTRFIYDTSSRLAFEIGPDGNVVEHRYSNVGEWLTLTYVGKTFDLSANSAPNFSDMTNWVNGLSVSPNDPTAVNQVYTQYDARGNISAVTTYAASTSPGNASTANGTTSTVYIYDQAGQLLSRKAYQRTAETFVYDGLGRAVYSVDIQGGTTSVLFDDANAKTIVTLSNGLTQKSTYDKAGELIAYTQSAAPTGGTNLKPDLTNASQWATARLTSPPTPTTIDGVPASQFMVTSTNGGLTTGPFSVNAGDTLTWEITLMGVTGSLSDMFGFYGNGGLGNPASGWGDGNQTTATILSGPGSITVQNAGGPSQVTGLSTSTGTKVRITRTFLSAENVYGFFYVKAPNTGTTSDGVVLAAPSIIRTTAADPQVTVATSTYAYDQLGRLRVTTDATGNKSYLEYDAVGRKIADIDQAGNVLEYKYDADNRVIATVRYTTPLNSTQLASLQSAPTTFDFASNRPTDTADSLWTFNVYDKGGRTIETIDGAGEATAYSYDASGKLIGTTAYANKLSAAQIANLKAMVSGTNLDTDLSNASQWTTSGLDFNSAGTINGAPATQYIVHATSVGGSLGTAGYIAVTAGDTLVFEVTVEGVAAGTIGSVTLNQTLSDMFGFYGASSHWGDSANMTATIVSGPGSLSGSSQNPWTISGLQAGAPTRIHLTRKFDTSENVSAYFYVKTSRGADANAGDSVILASPTIYRAPMTAAILPTADGTKDKTSRLFYDKTGRVVGTLDGEGYFSTVTYDAGGFKVAETAYAKQVDSGIRATANFATLSGNTSTADRTTHYVYDNEGMLTFVVDAKNEVTEYFYSTGADVIGKPTKTIQYADVIASPSAWTVAGVRAAINAVSGLATNANNRISQAYYDADENLIYSVDAAGGFTQFTYDAMGHVIKTVQYATAFGSPYTITNFAGSHSAEIGNRTTRNYYDARGDLTFTVDGEGYVTRYDYDGEDRLVGTTRWDVAVGGISDTTAITDLPTLIATAMASKSPTPTVITAATSYDMDGRVSTTTDGEGAITSYVYNANGTLSTKTEAYGTADAVQTYFVYDAAGRVTSRYDAYGSSDVTQTQFSYNAFGQLFTTTDPLGNTTTNNYDRDGRLTSVADAAAQTTYYQYNAFGEVVSTQDPRGYTSYTYYDTLGQVIWTRDAEGYVTGSAYTKFGELWTVTRYANKATNTADVNTLPTVTADTARDATTTFGYDARSRVKTVTDALNQAENYTLNAFGERQTATNAIGTITTYNYDHRGLLKSQVVDSGTGGKAITSSFGYDVMGHQVLETDALNHSSSTVYDRDGRVVQTIDALSNLTFYTHDRRGNLVTVKDALNNVTRRAYDKLDRLVYTVDPLGNVTKNTYDADGRVIATRAYAAPISATSLASLSTAPSVADVQALVASNDAADEQTRSVYDAVGRLRYTVDPGNFLTEYDYDAGGNVIRRVAYTTAITPAATYTITAIQTQINSMTSAVKAAARITRNVYSAEGKLNYTIDALGGITAYTHDAFGNTVKEVHLFTPYDGTDDPTDQAMSTWVGNHGSANDRITRAIYDQDGQLRFAIDAEQFVTQYTYDAVGNLRFTTRYADKFDGHNNLGVTYTAFVDGTTLAQALTNVAVTPSAAAAITELQYDSAGRLYKSIDALNTVTLLTLDQLGRAVSTDVANGTQDSSVTTRTFDAIGRVTSVTRGAGTSDASTTTSRYDALGRLTGTLDGNGSVQLAALGSNPTQAAIDNVYATYGTTYAYDADGNAVTTTVALDVGTSAVTTKTYDAFGNVVKLVDPRNNAGYFYYDALDRLILQIDPEGYATGTTYTASGKIDSVTRYFAKPTGPFSTTTRPTITPTAGSDAASSFAYDKLDRVTDTTQIVDTLPVDNVLEHFHYNVFGDRDTATSKLGSLTTNTYDKRGLLVSETMQVDATGATITNKYAYDARGNKISVVEAFGLPEQRTTTYDYYLTDLVKTKTGDAVPVQNANNLGTTSKAVVESYKYDLRGNLIEVTDANNASSFTYYDDLDRKVAEISAVGTLTTRTFDASGNVKLQSVYVMPVNLPGTPGGPAPTGTGTHRDTRLNYDRNNRLTSTVIVGVQYGEYVGGNYVYGTTDITTYTQYDAAGNVIVQTDGRNNSTYSYYNKLGQKTAQVDAANYLTTYDLDQNGNVKTETRYAKQLVGTPSIAVAPTPPTTTTDDRITTFLYDLAGRRTSESRQNVAASSLDANNQLTTATVVSTITYKYNGLGQVLQKTEANGDVTKQGYDLLGRMVHSEQAQFVDYRGVTVTPSTDMTYNGLNEVVQTTVHGDASFANGTTSDRITLNQYGAGGRLLSTTDPTGFATNYFYDNAGNVVAQTYDRKKADNSMEHDGVFITYDAAGRETSRKSGVLVSGAWTYGDTTDEYYDAFGEVVARGTNSGGDIANAQEFAEYDNAGHVWRTNFNDGVTKAYVYDRNGNATMLLQGNGTANLRSYASLGAIFADSTGAITQTISVFDQRNQLTDTIQPASNNAGANPIHAVQVDTTGSAGATYYNSSANVVSTSNAVATGAAGQLVTLSPSASASIGANANIQVDWYAYTSGGSIYATWNINLPPSAAKGAGNIHVIINGVEYLSNTNVLSDGSISVSSATPFVQDWNSAAPNYTVDIYQDVPDIGGSFVRLAGVFFEGYYNVSQQATVAAPATLLLKNENASATKIHMFARAAGSNGAYTEFDAPPLQNKLGQNVAGWFNYDLTQPPFNGLAANTSWDVKYLAMDAGGNVYDAKQGTMSVDANGSPSVRFDPVAVGGPGQAMLTNSGGHDLLVLSGLPSTAASGRILYRPVGSTGAWSIRALDSTAPFGQQGLKSVDVTGLGGPLEYWVELSNSSGTLLPTKLYGTFTVGGQPSALTQYVDASRAIQLNPPSGAAVTNQQFRYFQNGVWSSWIPHTGGDSWTWDAVGLTDFYSDRSYQFEYETYNGSTLVSHASGTMTLGYDGQSVSGFTNTVGSPAKVVFNPQQASAATLKLYWRDAGSIGPFSASTITLANGVLAWDIDADPGHPRPASGTRTLEYYYDAYASDGSILAPLNGDDHVRGTLVLANDSYTNPQNHETRWVIDTKAASQYLIHRSQSYNAFGEIVSEVDGKSATTSLYYDTLGKLTRKVSPQVQVMDETGHSTPQTPIETYYYDKSGIIIGKRDANSNLLANGPTTRETVLAGSGHGSDDALTLVQYNADGTHKTFGYDIFGDLRTSTDELNAVTQNKYDGAGRLVEVDHPTRVGGNSPNLQLKDYYGYDGLGERITHTNSVYTAAVVEKTDYDNKGRVTRTVDFGGLATNYTYTWYSIASNQVATAGLANYGGWQTLVTNTAGLTSRENDDIFGNVTWRQDFGGHTTSFTYDLTGHLTQQTGSTGQSIAFAYYANGYIASVTDNALHMKSTFEYDSEGNRTLETYNSTDAAPRFYQNAAVTYDALGRVTEFKDAKADITYAYDANGNRREVKSVYNDGVGGGLQTQDYWYKYDSMDRFTLTMGTLSNSVIGLGSNGVSIGYDAAGNRQTATYGYDGHTEVYSYTADGYLENTTIAGVVRAKRTNDEFGRVKVYWQYNASGGNDLSRTMTYDKENRVTDETDVDYTNGSVTTTVHNDYKAYVAGSGYTGLDQGVLTHTQSVQGSVTTQTTYSYDWWDEAKQAKITINATDPSNPNTGQWAAGYSQLTYDVNGHLSKMVDNAGNRVMTYQNDAYGQVLVREEKLGTTLGPRQLYYYFDGHRIGDVGNNGPAPSLTDYAQALAVDRNKPASKNGFRTGQPVASADFDENFQPINGSYPDQSIQTYTVRSGDTLQSIAQAVWGDASLWYLIADANGMTASTALVANQTLAVPNKVANFHNNANTFRVYNPGEAIGDTLPTLPPAPQPPAAKGNNCGAFGQILLVVIAVAVTIATHGIGAQFAASLGLSGTAATAVAGATTAVLGSIASQAVGVATGIQSSFSWKGVALAAIGGAVGGALTKVNAFGTTGAKGLVQGLQHFGNDVVRGALGSAISQGVGVVTGLQKNFDWVGVAAAGISAGVGGAVGRGIKFDPNLKGFNLANTLKGGVAGLAGSIGEAATRSTLEGSDFGDNVLSSLPGVIGNTIGTLIGTAIAGDGDIAAKRRAKPEDKTPVAGNGPPVVIYTPDDKLPISRLDPSIMAAVQAIDVGPLPDDIVVTASRKALSPQEEVAAAARRAAADARSDALDGKSPDGLPALGTFTGLSYDPSISFAQGIRNIYGQGIKTPGYFEGYGIRLGDQLKSFADLDRDALAGLAGDPKAQEMAITIYRGAAAGKEYGKQFSDLADRVQALHDSEQAIGEQGVRDLGVGLVKGEWEVAKTVTLVGGVLDLSYRAYNGEKLSAMDAVTLLPIVGKGVEYVRIGEETVRLSRGAAAAESRTVSVLERTGCFVAGTQVHTRAGLRPIEDISVGDYVLSQPEGTGERGYRKVTETFVYDDKSILQVTYQDSSGRTESVEATYLHPFWVKGLGWQGAQYLKAGQILELHDGGEANVVALTETGRNDRVHNFTVDGFHTYYVGELGIWVHNVGECGEIALKDLDLLHPPETIGSRPDLARLSDPELLDAVRNPLNGDRVKIDTTTGKLVDGNSRVLELQRRALDPSSKITPETTIPVVRHTRDNSMFWDF
jgi:YD repeat-containing protein